MNPSEMLIMYVLYTCASRDGVCGASCVLQGRHQLEGQHWRWGSGKRTPLVQVLDGYGFSSAEAL